jgi:phosphoribosylformimino-5-aminoimidazole carboxamide ribonucleotide (ProFAR) isomerase
VIVAGGVRDAGDVRRLALEAAIAGVVVGRALYEGVNLSSLLAAAAEADPGPPAPVDGAA